MPLLAAKTVAWAHPMPQWWAGVARACYVLMAFMLPANLLAVAAADDWRAVNPVFTLRMVTRIPFQYLLCCLACIALYALAGRAASTAAEAVGGAFLGTFFGVVIWVYLLSVAARVLGTLHYVYQDRIGWLA